MVFGRELFFGRDIFIRREIVGGVDLPQRLSGS
jgi:hypothetical protein